jgi:hypothetical protein
MNKMYVYSRKRMSQWPEAWHKMKFYRSSWSLRNKLQKLMTIIGIKKSISMLYLNKILSKRYQINDKIAKRKRKGTVWKIDVNEVRNSILLATSIRSSRRSGSSESSTGCWLHLKGSSRTKDKRCSGVLLYDCELNPELTHFWSNNSQQ